MTTVRLYFADDRIGPKFKRGTFRQGERVRTAIRQASQDASEDMVEQGRQDIASAGNFGSRWTEGLTSKVTEGGGAIRISMDHTLLEKGFRVHQFGATIRGKPLLWIPLSFANVPKGMYARDYPGGLFRVNRKGKSPLLFTRAKPARPVYFGRTQVRVPKRFRVIEKAREIARNMREYYKKRFETTNVGGE